MPASSDGTSRSGLTTYRRIAAQITDTMTTSPARSSTKKKALLNKKKGEENKVRYGNNLDRIQCAENITNFIYKAKTGEVVLKGKRVSIANFVKEAIDLNPETQQVEVDALNFQWKDNATQNINLGNMFPVIDVSGSMTSDDSLYYAIGLGLRIALKSRIGPMAMTFSDNPTLINLEGIPEDDFVAQVKFTQKAGWGGSTNLYKVFELFDQSNYYEYKFE